jgi:hypothetical protein
MIMLAMSASGRALPGTTYLTFSGPVALPGVNLEAGTYTFERMGSALEVVRVSSRDGRHVYLTAFTLPVPRPAGLDRNQPIVFSESARDVPPRIRAWFPEGEREGREFAYR